MTFQVGDRVVAEAESTERRPRAGTVREILREVPARYRIEWDRVVFRGDPAAREFIAFWVREGRVLAGMNVNVWDVNEHIQELVRSGASVDADRLRDPDVPLDELASS